MHDATPLLPWDPNDLAALLTLDTIAPLRFRSRHGDANLNGRAYGGQVLGQGLMAAAMTAPPDRAATAMQCLFLQGSLPHLPIEFEVTVLQDGGRFSSRHVRGVQQGGRLVLDAHASFAVAMRSPSHADASQAGETDPEHLPRVSQMPAPWASGLDRLGGYSIDEKPCIDFRVPDLQRQLDPARVNSRLRFWMKCRQALPARPGMQAAALAYLSDWWLNFSSVGLHVRDLRDDERLYVASLNHTLWFHRPFAADQWLHFDSQSPSASDGRALSTARVHDLEGRLVATATQECLMGIAGG